MMRGTVKRIVTDRKFGFIASNEGTGDFFFHESDLESALLFGALSVGDVVTFEPTSTPKGKRAVHVRYPDLKPQEVMTA